MGTKYPEWVNKCKRKGTAVHKIGNNFYLYAVGSKWDKKLGRAKKITKEYLGVITPDGLKEPGYRRNKVTDVKEYGSSNLLQSDNKDIVTNLKEYLGDWWKELFVLSVMRLMHQCPLKNIRLHYQDSWLSETIQDAKLDEHSIHKLLEDVGRWRGDIVRFLKAMTKSRQDTVLIDLTHMFSLSENMDLPARGFNRNFDYTPQVNLLVMFSPEQKMPLFYRVLPGNIRDVSSLKSTIEESGISNATIIGDKGFYSENNIALLEKEQLKYILPLKRNNNLIDYQLIENGDKKKFDGYFKYNGRFIWYYKCKSSNKKTNVWVYLDEILKTKESQDYLGRIETHPEFGYSKNKFHQNETRFGTITLTTNLRASQGKEVFQCFKSRVEIEILFDAFKNILHADRSYMRSNASLETWIFINYLSIIYYYRIYQKLIAAESLDKYSVNDVLLYLSKIRKVKISNHWIDLEIPKPTQKIIEKLNLHIT